MAHSVNLSDETFRRLADSAKAAGYVSIEAYLEANFAPAKQVSATDSLGRVRAIRDRVAQECGILPDSVSLIREDRER